MIACESLEAMSTLALGVEGFLAALTGLLNEALSMATARIVRPTRTLVLAQVTHEPFLAFAHRFKLVVCSTLAVPRAQVILFIARAHEVALVAQEAFVALAFSSVVFSQCTVSLARAYTDDRLSASSTRASEGAVVPQEAWIAGALCGGLGAPTTAHEEARL